MDKDQYKVLLDHATTFSWTKPDDDEPVDAAKTTPLQDLAQEPEETLPFLLETLRDADLYQRTAVLAVIDLIGYPNNAAAIPEMLNEIGADDWNSPAWMSALMALEHIGPDVVVPHIIKALLDQGEPYHHPSHTSETTTTWAEDIEGLTLMLCATTLDKEYARRCAPTAHYLLTQILQDANKNSSVVSCLLEIVEEGRNGADYMIPTLISILNSYDEYEILEKTRGILSSFSQVVLDNYKFILPAYSNDRP